MGILFVVFALVIVIVSGIPMAKKKLEENKKFKEYTENTQLGKNEIVGKIKDERTVNDKFISAMFYVGIVFLLVSGIGLIVNNGNENKEFSRKNSGVVVGSQPEVDTSNQPKDGIMSIDTNTDQSNTPVQNETLTTDKIAKNVKRERERINRLITENNKKSESLIEEMTKDIESKNTESALQKGEKALQSIKEASDNLNGTQCIPTGDANFDAQCKKLLSEGKNLYSQRQETVAKTMGWLKKVGQDVNDVKDTIESSNIGQQAISEGKKFFKDLIKSFNDNTK